MLIMQQKNLSTITSLALCGTVLLTPYGCMADIPTEAIEALGQKYELEFRRKDNKKNRQKAAREMVIEHPGGGLFFDEVIGVELNPEYQTTAGRSRRRQQHQSHSQVRTDQDDFILFQQFHHQQQMQKRQQQGMKLHDQLVSTYDTRFTGTRQRNAGGGLLWFHPQAREQATPVTTFKQSLVQYFQRMLQYSPATFGTSLACLVVFLLWQIVPNASWLLQYCVCSRQSSVKSHGLSILLSTVSHFSLRHLALNLLLFFHLAPKIWSTVPENTIQTYSSSKRSRHTKDIPFTPTPLWPLLLGSSLFSNGLFLAIRTNKTCLGLSGVVMAMMSYYYGGVLGNSTVPLQFWIGGILPISLPPRQLIRILVGVSFLGSFSTRSTIAHLVHLGGLIFGVLYYHATQRRIFQ
jgi:membrane associated rhomboid family serine protease